MSQLRQKAKTVREKGAARRRSWDPDPNSFHWRIYSWWLQSGKRVDRENFCHYWRVCLIWAPLRWTWKHLLTLLYTLRYFFGAVLLCGLGFSAVVLKWYFVPVIVGALAAIAYLVFSVLVGVDLASRMNPSEFGDYKQRWLRSRGMTIHSAAVLAAAPVVFVMYLLAGILGILVGLEEDYDLYARTWDQIKRFGRWTTQAHASDRAVLLYVRPWLVFPVGLCILSIWSVDLRIILGFIVAWACVVAGFGYLSDRATERRKALIAAGVKRKEEQEMEQRKLANQLLLTKVTPILSRLFVVLHPEWADDEDKYNDWLERYYRYWDSRKDLVSEYTVFQWASDRYEKRYHESYWMMWDALTSISVEAEACPGDVHVQSTRWRRLKAFRSGVVDMFALLWQIGLTKKWGICPLVKLPEPAGPNTDVTDRIPA